VRFRVGARALNSAAKKQARVGDALQMFDFCYRRPLWRSPESRPVDRENTRKKKKKELLLDFECWRQRASARPGQES
jgi:hypothetical protein